MIVTIATVDYDAFQTLEGADEYLAADIARAVAWAGYTDDDKGRGLVSATRMMLALPWCDTAPDPTVDQDSPIPEVCAMLAADLIAKPALQADASGTSNIKSVGAGPAKVEFFAPVDGGPPLPLALWGLLEAAGLVCLNGYSDIDAALDAAQPFGTSDGCRPLGGRYPWDWPVASEDYG